MGLLLRATGHKQPAAQKLSDCVKSLTADVGLIDAELLADELLQAAPIVETVRSTLPRNQSGLKEVSGSFVLDQFLGAVCPCGDLIYRIGAGCMLNEKA